MNNKISNVSDNVIRLSEELGNYHIQVQDEDRRDFLPCGF